jgi:hypothetical protein
MAAEVDEAQDAGGPRGHLSRRQRRHSSVIQHLACVASEMQCSAVKMYEEPGLRLHIGANPSCHTCRI